MINCQVVVYNSQAILAIKQFCPSTCVVLFNQTCKVLIFYFMDSEFYILEI